MAETKQTLSAAIAIGIDLSALGTDDTFLTGRESDEVDNSTLNYLDALVNIDAIVAGVTVPVIGDVINVYVWGSDTALSATNLDVLDGVDSGETLAHASVLNSLRFAGSAGVTVASASLSYYVQPFSIAALFDGIMPDFWGIFIAQNMGGTLAASQTGKVTYQGLSYTTT